MHAIYAAAQAPSPIHIWIWIFAGLVVAFWRIILKITIIIAAIMLIVLVVSGASSLMHGLHP
jgi:hypothetical protein